ncbi:hypothetical protein N431DRAFT_438366 [Stipitochalara longipes BDJ]|nr:hypothetical protein N431DRAFT_438366 [Stipitochalara longipes BDJ]
MISKSGLSNATHRKAVEPTARLLHPPFSSKISFNEGIVSEALSTSQNSDDRIPVRFRALLPVFCGKAQDGQLRRPLDDVASFLREELDLRRLDTLLPGLWIAGLRMRHNALHTILLQNKRFNRKIIITERIDIHLVSAKKALYIKPLPAYLLDYHFWAEYLCLDEYLYSIALGFLFSYASMIRSRIDFQAAVHGDGDGISLLPPGLTWPQWTSFIEDFSTTTDLAAHKAHERFEYTILRLSRLNILARIGHRSLMRGYYSGEEHKAWYDFWERDIAWILVVLAFLLTAMQVGLATDILNKNDAFQSVSYGVTVLCLVLPVASVVLLFAWYLMTFLYDFLAFYVRISRVQRMRQRSEDTAQGPV